ncbi:ATP-dependent DNA helicase PcrA [Proteiniphilum saccharofermentans]|uniref:DNA 3'-5' helicase n=1 Tax=Proteiniphilum saccharofermentans TaxID=1642647 RepID=A0A1R3T6C5_9BACT|nr:MULTISPECIES: UvrD-helicase domain-containing protein [Proteiniphilum]SCD21782.1 ATP-dependent DNA helicase PcrA [Proteiniphilum saccharofermentans]SFL16662.1 DNA helicase-2 / ATP-dependent DNA helicase PcrA [Porphyromonadaceae bacterium KH3CP3RA]
MQKTEKNSDSGLLSHLNEAQRAAVAFCDGPSLVIAGAGSGKTRVLTYKIAYLLEQGLPPYYILALTFTNKAAREMKSRIADLVGEKRARRLWMGTFHSIFARILRSEAEAIGFQSNFTIFDSSDSNNLVRLIIKEMELDDKQYRPGVVHGQISRAKNSLITPAMYAANTEIIQYDRMAKRPQLFEIYQRYQSRLRSGNSMDFDDLLMYTNILFRDHKEVLEKYRNQFQYILVDEYQDTNFAQHLIVKQLADAHHRVCVVGDDAQSIYSFRGANIDNILKFKSNFPGTQIFKLEQNYRSTRNIVNAANSLIKKNSEQIFKNVFSENEEGEKIEIRSAFSDFEEALIVSNKIARMRLEKYAGYNDFAILYRTNAQSRAFEEALRKNNIPYRIYGGLSFYQRKEIKDIISYFRLIVNPNDEEAFRRIINYPTRGIGAVTVAKITSTAQRHNVSLWQVVTAPLEYNLDVNTGTAKKLEGFYSLIQGFIDKNETMNAFELAQEIIKNSGIAKEAYDDMTPEGMSRAQNMQELLNAMNEFVETQQEQGEENIRLADFLSEVSLLTDQDTDNEADNERVTLMTVHSAKGLEFDHVFVVGLEEDLFPSAMAKSEIRGLEEERRLFYVAITRAKKSCTITYAKSRFRNGQTNPATPSRFLKDIDSSYIEGGENDFITRTAPADDFWGSMREQRLQNTMSNHTITPKRVVPVQRVASSTPLSKEAQELEVGHIIEHERFGRGVVTSIEMSGNDRRAFVEFESAGKKQLLLKFAKFSIVE